MIGLVPFEVEHLELLVVRDGDRRELMNTARMLKPTDPAFTAVDDKDRILGCSGVIVGWPGVGFAWAILTNELMKEYPIWTTRTIRSTLQHIVKTYDLHRLEMVALPERIPWALAIGFSKENGCARSYTADKRDVVRLEMIK